MQINKQKYTISQVEGIIDSHIESDTNFTFVCNFELAHYIYDYLGNEYDVEADSIELSSEVDEYYVSLNFYKNDITFVCEYAKWDQAGTYKYDDGDKIDYFVFSNMSFGDIREYLSRDGCIRFCELIDEDCIDDTEVESMDEYECENGNVDEYLEDDNCVPCQCDDCCESRGEFDDEDECFCQECNQEREEDLIDQCVEVILNGCTDCAIKCVVNTLLTFKKLGKLEMKQEMKDFLED